MRARRGQRGFTLAEVACVVGISGVLAGLFAVAGVQAKKASDRHRAQAGVAAIEAAIHSFQVKRSAFPRDVNGDGVTRADEILEQLKGWRVLEQSFSPLDPWGNPYVVVLKRDYGVSSETVLDYNLYPVNETPDGFQVYSKGPDGKTGYMYTEETSVDNIGNYRT
jgi:prepilin-type N-terminal cleavage/methylation domain-containing protein